MVLVLFYVSLSGCITALSPVASAYLRHRIQMMLKHDGRLRIVVKHRH